MRENRTEAATTECPTCSGTGLVPFGLPSNGPDPCPACTPDRYRSCPLDPCCGIDINGDHDPWCNGSSGEVQP